MYRLSEKADEAAAALFKAARALGRKLGPILFQLPPNCKRDGGRLERFLGTIPRRGVRAAFEFRHDSWFVPETLAALGRARAALCVAEHVDGFRTPVEATAPSFVYRRLRRARYDAAELRAWAARLDAWARGGRDVYCYFRHEDGDGANGPRFARETLDALGGVGKGGLD